MAAKTDWPSRSVLRAFCDDAHHRHQIGSHVEFGAHIARLDHRAKRDPVGGHSLQHADQGHHWAAFGFHGQFQQVFGIKGAGEQRAQDAAQAFGLQRSVGSHQPAAFLGCHIGEHRADEPGIFGATDALAGLIAVKGGTSQIIGIKARPPQSLERPPTTRARRQFRPDRT